MTLRLRIASCAALALVACEPQSQEPPLFNARDLGVQCPTGQVGWDFSTGGNDSSIVENSVSREITIDSATLGTCDYKADFATDCDGKRDCTRLVRKTTSPACAAGGVLDLTYHCGEEAPRYNVVIPADASGKTVNLGCAEPMVIFSAVHASNAPPANQLDMTVAIASACTGKRRCSLRDPHEILGGRDPWPGNHKETLIKYYCGTDPVLKEAIVPSSARVDIQCPLNEAPPPVFNDTLRILNVTCANPSQCSIEAVAAKARLWKEKVKACEGKRSCRLELERDNFLSPPGELSFELRVDYYCSSPQAPESKVFFNTNRHGPHLNLYCGAPIRIVGAALNGNLAKAREACDFRSRCVLPPVVGVAGQARYQYTCGDNLFEIRESMYITETAVGSFFLMSPYQRQIECDRTPNRQIGGIRVVSATNSSGGDGLLAATSLCYGRDVCDLRGSGFRSVTYRCGNSYHIKNLENGMLSCVPDVNLISLECDNTNRTEFSPESRLRRECLDTNDPAQWLNAQFSCGAGNNGRCELAVKPGQLATLKWRCGQDPKIYTYEGSGELLASNPTRIAYIKPSCEIPAVPYVEKGCVPDSCAGNQRRDSKLTCIPDGTLTRTETHSGTLVKEWLRTADGGTSQWGGADTTTLREDHPYQIFGYSNYKTATGAPLPPNTAVTTIAYDEFVLTTNPTKVTFGFRCVVAEAPIRNAEYPTPTPFAPGFRRIINGGKGAVLPLSCFRQNVEDGRNAWSDAARRVGIPESQFRQQYTRKTSWVASAFDGTGRFTARQLANGQLARAVNPIGFFYNSQNGWIDQLGFYLQRLDLRYKRAVTFVESNEIQLSAMRASLRDANIKVDVGRPTLLPSFDVDFTWSQRGDSPARNPLSPKSILTANAAKPLNKRKLRATIEIGRVSLAGSGLPEQEQPGEWVEVNSTSFPATELGSGNAMSTTNRLSAVITPALRERLLTLKGTDPNELQAPNGFMHSFDEDKSVFRVRVCMDFEDVAHALGPTDTPASSLDNRGVTVLRDGTEYGLKFLTRCSQAGPLLVERELFTYPTVPYVTVEAPANSASSPRQGDSAAGSTNDMGNQSNCSETNSDQTCRGQSRNSMVTGGQFSLSAFDTGSEDTTEQKETVKTTKLSTNMTVFGFKIFDLSNGQMAEPQSSGAWQVKIDISPNLQSIMEAWKSRKAAGVKTKADNQKMKSKGKKGAVAQFLSDHRDGLALKIGKEFPFTLGPFPFVLEVSFSVGFGFGASIKLAGDRQTTTNMVNPKYPCLKSTPGQCVVAYPEMGNTVKTFEQALQDCRFKGGVLAEIRTPTDLTEVKTAVESIGTANSAFWLGAQASYQYASSKCNDLPTPQRCAGTSRTRWSWLTGNTPIGTQLRQEPVVFVNSNHGFQANDAGVLTTYVPDRGAALFKKDTEKLISARVTDTAAWVCQFDPASSYIETSIGVEVKAEFSMGFQAKICTPSADIGFCLGVGINLVTAGVNVSAERSRIMIFNNNRTKIGLIGESKVAGAWEVAFISGNFSAELNFLFSSLTWEIASYGGIFKLEGDLFPEIVSPYARTFP